MSEEAVFVDRLGLFMEMLGGSRTMGRVYGWLLISDPPQQSLTELAQTLSSARPRSAPSPDSSRKRWADRAVAELDPSTSVQGYPWRLQQCVQRAAVADEVRHRRRGLRAIAAGYESIPFTPRRLVYRPTYARQMRNYDVLNRFAF
jgi:hypothetical protein